MQSIKRMRTEKKNKDGSAAGKVGNRMKKVLSAVAMAGIFTFASPVMENEAKAEGGRIEHPCSDDGDIQCTVNALQDTQVTFNNGEDKTAYLVIRSQSVPIIEIEGPAVISMNFYPALNSERFSESDRIIREVECNVESDSRSTVRSFEESIGISPHTSEMVGEGMIAPNMVVGNPINMEIELEEGTHEISVQSYNGFLEICNVGEVPEDNGPEEEEPAEVEPPQPEESGNDETQDDVEEPVAEPDIEQEPEEEEPIRQLIAFDGERTVFGTLGDSTNVDRNYSEISGNIWLTDMIAISPGIYFSTHGADLWTEETTTRARTISTDLSVGVDLRIEEHRFSLDALIGYRWTPFDVRFESDSTVSRNRAGEFEYGGAVSYGYDEFFFTHIHADSNPFNPLRARFEGAIPLTWARVGDHVAYPELGLEISLLRSLKAIEGGTAGALEIGYNNLYMGVNGRVPTYWLGPVLVSVDLAGDINISEEGFQWADFSLGGTIGVEHNGFELNFSGLGSPITGRYFLTADISYAR